MRIPADLTTDVTTRQSRVVDVPDGDGAAVRCHGRCGRRRVIWNDELVAAFAVAVAEGHAAVRL